MALYRLGDVSPSVAPSAYVAPSAAVVGKAVLADRSSVWFGAILRGDNELISIGAGSNVQDGAVLRRIQDFRWWWASMSPSAIRPCCTAAPSAKVR